MHIYLETEPRMYNWMFWKPRPIPCVLESSKINSPLESGWPFSPFHWQICLSERGEKGGKHPTQHAQLSPHNQQSRLKWHPHLSLAKGDDVLQHTEPSPSIPAIPQKKRYKKVQTESQGFKKKTAPEYWGIAIAAKWRWKSSNAALRRSNHGHPNHRRRCSNSPHARLLGAPKVSPGPSRFLVDHFPWVICMVICMFHVYGWFVWWFSMENPF